MADTNPAVFQLNKFIIPQFTIEQEEDDLSIIDIKLNPAGIYNTLNGEYQVVLVFMAFAINEEKKEEEPKLVLSGAIKAFFTISDKPEFKNIPSFFFQNSLAIIFPYLRAFISNITLQAGLRVMILPLLNLTNLSDTLKENTKVFE
jgi:preprotein translocase subunit SecB